MSPKTHLGHFDQDRREHLRAGSASVYARKLRRDRPPVLFYPCPLVTAQPNGRRRKRFRLYFRFNRELLRKLPGLAWKTVLEVCRAVLGRDDVVPSMVAAIQTHGQLSNWHPHIHALTTYGAFSPDGTFIPLPDDLSTTPFLEVWQAKIFRLLLDEGRITPEVIEQMRSWRHSGFSVDKSVSLAAGDTAGLERVAAYMVRYYPVTTLSRGTGLTWRLVFE